MHVCSCIHACNYMHACIHIYIYTVHTSTHTRTCIPTHTYMQACMHTYVHTNTNKQTNIGNGPYRSVTPVCMRKTCSYLHPRCSALACMLQLSVYIYMSVCPCALVRACATCEGSTAAVAKQQVSSVWGPPLNLGAHSSNYPPRLRKVGGLGGVVRDADSSELVSVLSVTLFTLSCTRLDLVQTIGDFAPDSRSIAKVQCVEEAYTLPAHTVKVNCQSAGLPRTCPASDLLAANAALRPIIYMYIYIYNIKCSAHANGLPVSSAVSGSASPSDLRHRSKI